MAKLNWQVKELVVESCEDMKLIAGHEQCEEVTGTTIIKSVKFQERIESTCKPRARLVLSSCMARAKLVHGSCKRIFE